MIRCCSKEQSPIMIKGQKVNKPLFNYDVRGTYLSNNNTTLKNFFMGRGGGQVVSVLAFHSKDLSANPTEVCNFYVKYSTKKRPGFG